MFSKDFLWGSASAAYQIEGAASTNNKGESIWDVYSKVPGNTFKDTTGEVAIDFYNRYKEDIALMAEQNLKAYRFSVSWPRIFPNGSGEVNKEGIEFYHNVIDELIANNIEPVLTVYHWDLPEALQKEYGGWEDRKIIDDFVNYCKVLFEEYGSKVKYFVTLNEQNIFTTLGYILKVHPPKVNDFNRFLVANHNANLANAKAIKLFKDMNLEGKIGPSFAYNPYYAKSEDPKDVIAMENAQELQNWFWMDVYVKGEYPKLAVKLLKDLGYEIPMQDGDDEILKSSKPDFMGVNYYQTATVGAVDSNYETVGVSKNTVDGGEVINPPEELYKVVKSDHAKLTDWNWTIDPEGLRVALRRITSRYDLPILITENGLGAFDELTEDKEIHDDYRIDYLNQHINAIGEAIKDGSDVIGYCTWSFQDLFSWLNGYQKRYGFVYVDRDELDERELKRYKKDSFYWYRDIINKYSK